MSPCRLLRRTLFSSCLALGALTGWREALTPGDVPGAYTRAGNTFSLRTRNAEVRLEFCTPELVRVRTKLEGEWAPDEHVMVATHAWPPVAVSARDVGEGFVFESASLSVRVEKHPLKIAF